MKSYCVIIFALKDTSYSHQRVAAVQYVTTTIKRTLAITKNAIRRLYRRQVER